jgi:hypothetical protein
MPYDSACDPYGQVASSFTAQARDIALITPSDSIDLACYAKALRVFVPSSIADDVATVKVTPARAADDAPVTLNFCPGVSVEPLAVRRVWASGTSAGVVIHGYL